MRQGHHGLHVDAQALLQQLRVWAQGLGFSQIAVAGVDLADAEPGLLHWLDNGWHGSMDYMARHGLRRARPAELVPGTLSVVTARMDYLPRDTEVGEGRWQRIEWDRLADARRPQVSVYARGRDYHKVMRPRLQQLADRLAQEIGPFGHRVFTDSAPVLEVELAARSGLGWRGKHTLALHREAGSMFFLGEIFTDLALPPTPATSAHCGECSACLDACPTGAIVAPYRLDARRCISYLTIEHEGSIPHALRAAIGNRLYGCDDCQLACPWNKFARPAQLADFDARRQWQDATLPGLWGWSEAAFLAHTEGSPIRRIGFERWQRNLAVVSGNALRARDDAELRACMLAARPAASALVAEHIDWALAQSSGPGQSARGPERADHAASASGTLAMPISVDTVTRPATNSA